MHNKVIIHFIVVWRILEKKNVFLEFCKCLIYGEIILLTKIIEFFITPITSLTFQSFNILVRFKLGNDRRDYQMWTNLTAIVMNGMLITSASVQLP